MHSSLGVFILLGTYNQENNTVLCGEPVSYIAWSFLENKKPPRCSTLIFMQVFFGYHHNNYSQLGRIVQDTATAFQAIVILLQGCRVAIIVPFPVAANNPPPPQLNSRLAWIKAHSAMVGNSVTDCTKSAVRMCPPDQGFDAGYVGRHRNSRARGGGEGCSSSFHSMDSCSSGIVVSRSTVFDLPN